MKLRELPVGSLIIDASGLTFLVGDHQHSDYPGTVLITEKVIDRRALDLPKEHYEDAPSRKFGSNDYPHTDLHEWLNDRSEGFASWLSADLYDALKTCQFPYGLPSGEITSPEAKFFLPSLCEIGVECPDHIAEGSQISLFRDFRRRFALPSADVVAAGRHPGYGVLSESDSWCYWLRSSHPLKKGVQYLCHSHSPYVFMAANRNYVGVRPICCADSNLEVCAVSRPLKTAVGMWKIVIQEKEEY